METMRKVAVNMIQKNLQFFVIKKNEYNGIMLKILPAIDSLSFLETDDVRITFNQITFNLLL